MFEQRVILLTFLYIPILSFEADEPMSLCCVVLYERCGIPASLSVFASLCLEDRLRGLEDLGA